VQDLICYALSPSQRMRNFQIKGDGKEYTDGLLCQLSSFSIWRRGDQDDDDDDDDDDDCLLLRIVERTRTGVALPGLCLGPIFWACRDDDDDQGERKS
jgi:hypothetical protein